MGLILVALWGCGQGTPRKQPEAVAGGGGSDSPSQVGGLPDLKMSLSTGESTLARGPDWEIFGESWALREVVTVPREAWARDRFRLEFPSRLGGVEVSEVVVQCHPSVGSESLAAYERGRWWVPLPECVGGAVESLDPEKWLTLQALLRLADGTELSLRLSLRLAGPVVGLKVATRTPEQSPLDHGALRARQETALLWQEITNDGPRSAHIELARPETPQLVTIIQQSIPFDRAAGEDRPVELAFRSARFYAETPVVWTRVELLTDKESESRTWADADQGSLLFRVGSKQKLSLVWYGRLSPDAVACPLPAPRVRDLRKEFDVPCGYRCEHGSRVRVHTGAGDERHDVVGAQVAWPAQQAMRVFSHGPQSEFVSDEEVRPVNAEGLPRFSCQGVF